MQNRHVDITIGGLDFRLQYAAQNLWALSKITGTPHISFISEMAPRKDEDTRQAGARCSDISYLAPLIVAGLAHMPEYRGKSTDELIARVCGLLDKECETQNESLAVVCAKLVEKIIQVVMLTLLPPGETIDSMKAETEGDAVQQGPLDEPGRQPSLGGDG